MPKLEEVHYEAKQLRSSLKDLTKSNRNSAENITENPPQNSKKILLKLGSFSKEQKGSDEESISNLSNEFTVNDFNKPTKSLGVDAESEEKGNSNILKKFSSMIKKSETQEEILPSEDQKVIDNFKEMFLSYKPNV